MQVWTSPSEEEDEKHFGHLATFWFGTFAMLISRYNSLPFIFECFSWQKCTQWWLQVSCFWDFERFSCISIILRSALSLHIESINSMIAMTQLAGNHWKMVWDWSQFWFKYFCWHRDLPGINEIASESKSLLSQKSADVKIVLDIVVEYH